ncbi:hypothetical protein SZ64_07755 [Erythrobacter sp. SG61-1L]|uniref:DUF6334 family protein n=1 Tax=Erythrobacter sp. SG61-1L TaxID=1603897 RepID=UPI0006C8F143|nr:DUF6334 family protein [Erythrobacter sp. SG61-1L]KPL68027.1 hypothetical protein SZ64_07755 [Erythrobacter sp. SG61-1L]
MLQFDWEEVEGATVAGVFAKGARCLDDGSLECKELALKLDSSAVILRVNPDTDEVIVTLEPFDGAVEGWQTLPQLQGAVSHKLGWCWIGRNFRGYLDCFSFALDGIDPAYSFTGIASALHCMRITSIAG